MGSELDIVVSPILSISLKSLKVELDQYPTLVFTSSHAVQAVIQQTAHRSFKCYTVGSATLACALEHGFDATEGGGTAEKLAQRVIEDDPPTPCLYLRGEHIAYDLSKALNSAGIETHESIVYEQEEHNLSEEALRLLASGRPVVLPVFSARSARLFFDNYKSHGPLDIVAISEKVASKVPSKGIRQIRICEHPTADAMISEIAILLRGTNQLEGRLSPK